MDMDENLVKLQGALSSFSVAVSDDEKLQILRPIFEHAKESDKTKMIFFMVLNTKMKISELLKDDDNVGLLTDICENLDFQTLGYVIFNLNLVGSLNGIVSNSPAALSIELLNGIFAYADSRDQIKGMDKVITAIFEKILKISKGIYQDKSYISELWNLMYLYGNMMWSNKLFDYGDSLDDDVNTILETCLVCVNLFKGNTEIQNNPIFELGALYNKSDESDLNSEQEVDCKTKLEEYIFKLLDLFNDMYNKDHVKNISESAVKLLSESAYKLCEELKACGIEPSNVSYLDSIKKKPETESEKIMKCDINTIISKITNDKISKNWFKALINIPDIIENEEALICLANHLDIADSEDIRSITVLLESKLKNNYISDIVQNLYFSCLSKMIFVDQLSFFENYFKLDLRPCFESSTTDEELIESFNKMSESEGRDIASKKCLLMFCMRSPIKTITKICKQALTNATQLNIAVENLKMLKAACLANDFSSEQAKWDIITSILSTLINSDLNIKEKQLLTILITRLQKEEVVNENTEICIVNVIHKELSQMNYDKATFALEILRSSAKLGLLRSNKSVLIAFMSQVLNATSWSCSSFSMKLVEMREIVIAIITLIMRNPKFSASDLELAWVRKKISKSWEINQIYFCDLWYSYDCNFIISSKLYTQLFILLHTKTRFQSLISFICEKFKSKKLKDLKVTLTAAFIYILPILTSREWTSLVAHIKSIINAWSDFQVEKPDIDVNVELFRIFTMSLYFLAQDLHQNKDMMPCFAYCVRNFGKIIQQNFLTCKNLKSEICIQFVKEVLFLLNGIRDRHQRKECAIILSPVILEIRNRAGNIESEKEGELEQLQTLFKKYFIERS